MCIYILSAPPEEEAFAQYQQTAIYWNAHVCAKACIHLILFVDEIHTYRSKQRGSVGRRKNIVVNQMSSSGSSLVMSLHIISLSLA